MSLPRRIQKRQASSSSSSSSSNALAVKRPSPPTNGSTQVRLKGKAKSSKNAVIERSERTTLATERVRQRPALREVLERRDPLVLGDKVKALLRQGKDEDAYALVHRASSNRMNVTVSWNYVIGWELQQNRLARAWKAYQDMKKRGQIPDSYTFTALFRGLAREEYRSSPIAMERAMTIYNSLFLEKSPIKGPSTIHLNAMLAVCHTARNVTAMWEVINKLPTYKERKIADRITFTTVLNTLYAAATDGRIGSLAEDGEKRRAVHDQAISDGKRVWVEAVARWKNGEVKMDHGLVGSMARLLLLGGDRRNSEDVLLLVSQTVRVRHEKVVPLRRPSAETMRQIISPPSSESLTKTKEGGTSRFDAPPASIQGEIEITGSNKGYKTEFQPVDPSEETRLLRSSYFVDPSPEILSAAMVACLRLGDVRSALHYWNALTKDGAMRPDIENAMALLRVLRLCRDSQAAAELIRSIPLRRAVNWEEVKTSEQTKHDKNPEMPSREPKLGAIRWAESVAPAPKLFRLAMTTCRRNSAVPTALHDAISIRSTLQQISTLPDARVLRDYIAVLRKTWTGDEAEADSEQRRVFHKRLGDEMSVVELSVKSFSELNNLGLTAGDKGGESIEKEVTKLSAKDKLQRQQRDRQRQGRGSRTDNAGLEAVPELLAEYRSAIAALVRGWNPSRDHETLKDWQNKLKRYSGFIWKLEQLKRADEKHTKASWEGDQEHEPLRDGWEDLEGLNSKGLQKSYRRKVDRSARIKGDGAMWTERRRTVGNHEKKARALVEAA